MRSIHLKDAFRSTSVPCRLSQAAQVSVGGKAVRVSMSPVWSKQYPKNIYKSHDTSYGLTLCRRSTPVVSIQEGVDPNNAGDNYFVASAGLQDQQGKIRLDSNSAK